MATQVLDNKFPNAGTVVPKPQRMIRKPVSVVQFKKKPVKIKKVRRPTKFHHTVAR